MRTSSSCARADTSIQSFDIVEQQLDFIDYLNSRFRLEYSDVKHNLAIRFLNYFGTAGIVFKGTTGVKVRIGALCTKEARTSGFREYSRQSADTALNILEQHHYIRVAGRRLRGNRGIRIIFLPKLLSLIAKALNPSLKLVSDPCVPPPPVISTNKGDDVVEEINEIGNRMIEKCSKPEHIDTHVKKVEIDKNTSKRQESQNSDILFHNKGNTRAFENDNHIMQEKTTRAKTKKIKKLHIPKNQKKIKKGKNAILWSALQTGKQDGIQQGIIEKLYHIAKTEIDAPHLFASGIDYEHWLQQQENKTRWQNLGPEERDFICRTIILPKLLALLEKKEEPPIPTETVPTEPEEQKPNNKIDRAVSKHKEEAQNHLKRIEKKFENGEITAQEFEEHALVIGHLYNLRIEHEYRPDYQAWKEEIELKKLEKIAKNRG